MKYIKYKIVFTVLLIFLLFLTELPSNGQDNVLDQVTDAIRKFMEKSLLIPTLMHESIRTK